MRILYYVGIFFLSFIQSVYADHSITIPISLLNANGQEINIGTIVAKKVSCGILFTPNLSKLSPGVHGFHIHKKPSCDNKGMAAGGHFDPHQTNQHQGPYQHGHSVDLPVLVVDQSGRATLPTLAPHLKFSQIKGHALMIHAGADNYSDQPEKLGGGGERIACGIIPTGS